MFGGEGDVPVFDPQNVNYVNLKLPASLHDLEEYSQFVKN